MARLSMPAEGFYVYVLFRHDTGQPFYVGKGKTDRWRHSLKVSGYNRHKVSIVRQAKAAGREVPVVIIRDGMSETEAFDLERTLIAAIGRRQTGSGPLVNLTDGGDGEAGKIMSAAARALIGAAHKGRTLTPEHRAAISAGLRLSSTLISVAQRARFANPGQRAKAGAANKGRKMPPSWFVNQRLNNQGHTGHKHSPEARAKMSAKLRGKSRMVGRINDPRQHPLIK